MQISFKKVVPHLVVIVLLMIASLSYFSPVLSGKTIYHNNPIIFGDGTRSGDFIHVDDVNAFHLQCLVDNRTVNETFNLGMNNSNSLYDISQIIFEYLKDEIPADYLEYDNLPEINGEAHTIYSNIDKAKAIGWAPQKTIEDAIYDTIDYLKLEIEKGNVDPTTFMSGINSDDLKI